MSNNQPSKSISANSTSTTLADKGTFGVQLISHEMDIFELRRRCEGLEKWKESVCKWIEKDFGKRALLSIINDVECNMQAEDPATAQQHPDANTGIGNDDYETPAEYEEVEVENSQSTVTPCTNTDEENARMTPSSAPSGEIIPVATFRDEIAGPSREMGISESKTAGKLKRRRTSSIQLDTSSDEDLHSSSASAVKGAKGSVNNEGGLIAVKMEPGAEEIDPTPCSVCDKALPEYENAMVFCDKCKVCVHQACYGILEVPQETESWACNPCLQNLDTVNLKCLFCPQVGGALKPVAKPEFPKYWKQHEKEKLFEKWAQNPWAHPWCGWWIPETRIHDPSRMEPIHKVENIPKFRWKERCFICKSGGNNGTVIMCYKKGCKNMFHPSCGKKGAKMTIDVSEMGNEDTVFEAFCKNHKYKNKRRKPLKRTAFFF